MLKAGIDIASQILELIGFDILFLGGITLIAFCVGRELWEDPRLAAAFCPACRKQIRGLFCSTEETGGKADLTLMPFAARLLIAALMGMVINLTADKVLDDEDWVRRFPRLPWCDPWQDEDQLKRDAVEAAVTLGTKGEVANTIRNHASLDAAKSLIQHAYPVVQKSENSRILTGLRYEFLVVKVLRVFLILVVGLYLIIVLRAGFLLVQRRERFRRIVGLLFSTMLAFALFELLLSLWTAQSTRYYKKLVHAYIVLATDAKSLSSDQFPHNWVETAKKALQPCPRYLLTTTATEHYGACDGSNAIASGPSHFLGTSDENNVIRLFEIAGPNSQPLFDLNDWLGFPQQNGKFRECDLEGAARIGDLIFWIGSHGANNEGKERKERQVFFATTITGSGENTKVEPFGKPYKELLRDLISDTRLADFKLSEASHRAPKDPGAINIEGLCAVGDSLYIGFRNPIPGGRALILPLINPREVVETGAAAKFDKPILLNLGGLGIRAMVPWNGAFLIVAGDYRDGTEAGAKPFQLFCWEGNGAQPSALKVQLRDFNPEGALVFEKDGKQRLLLLSDDGSNIIDGVEMKDLDPSKQRFRSVLVKEGDGD